MIYDVAIIGAGASGLMAAQKIAGFGKKIAVLDGNSKPGKKLLVTGNGRCNLTNLNLDKKFYHGDDTGSLLDEFTAERIIAEFEEIGILSVADEEGRVYPRNLQAAAVQKLLLNTCVENGAAFIYDFTVISAKKKGDSFHIKSEDGREIAAKKLILAAGGKASPKHSSALNGYEIAGSLGHSCTELLPALTQVVVTEKFTKAVKGMRVKAKARLMKGKTEIYSESGEVIFSDYTLSGICIFNISGHIADMLRTDKHALEKGEVKITLDMAEAISNEKLIAYFESLQRAHPRMRVIDILSGLLNIKVGEEIIRSLKFDIDTPIGKLEKADFEAVSFDVKNKTFTASELGSFENAQVTSGGIPLSEINMETMESEKCGGLYIIGELLNVNGDCGGYNLHFAWATALSAAGHLTRR